jgi:2-polyprenyl-3-methyl-5-hydroxy-6-metoxy-1,4-benzoquinol methylase
MSVEPAGDPSNGLGRPGGKQVSLTKDKQKWSNHQVKNLILQKMTGTLTLWEREYLDFHTARFKDTLNLLGPGEGKRLLDLGAFPGHLTLAVQALGYQVEAVTGTNESARGLQNFITRLSGHQIPVTLADVEFQSFPFQDKSFDVVLAAEIIEHLPYNPYHMLREAFRVLKPGGRIILSTPNLPKLDNLLHFLKGQTIHPDIQLPFYKTFKSILIGRHIREYTASELIYMLEEQNKEMYRFEGTQVSYTMCLDPAFSWAGAVSWMIKRLWSRFQATIFLQAFRPERLELISPGDMTIQGCHEQEEHPHDMGSTGRVLATPFCWTKGQSEISLPAADAKYQVFFIHLVFLAPKYLPPAILNIGIGETSLGQVGLPPGREYVLLRLALPALLARGGRFPLCLESSTWRPVEHDRGIDYYEFSTTDTRDLGVAIGWDGFLREDCDNQEELRKVAQRECRRQRLHEGNEGRWSPLSGLYLIRTQMKPSLTLGPGDWRQLGLGWHHLERWKQGWMRWSSRKSEVYLEPGQKSGRLGIRIYTGDKALGQEISGTVKIEWAADRLLFFPLAEQPFSLPSDQFTDLMIDPLPSLTPGGLFRVLIQVDTPRIPARLIPGSQDGRVLGLAVFGFKISKFLRGYSGITYVISPERCCPWRRG